MPVNYNSGIFNTPWQINPQVYGVNNIYGGVLKGSKKADKKQLEEAFAQGLREGFISPDIALFEGEQLQPTLQTDKLTDLDTHPALQESIKKFRQGELDWEGVDSDDKRRVKLDARRTRSRNIAAPLTPVTIGDDFTIINRRAIRKLKKGDNDLIANIADIRGNPIPKEELTETNYNIREFMTPPKFAPKAKKVTELKVKHPVTKTETVFNPFTGEKEIRFIVDKSIIAAEPENIFDNIQIEDFIDLDSLNNQFDLQFADGGKETEMTNEEDVLKAVERVTAAEMNESLANRKLKKSIKAEKKAKSVLKKATEREKVATDALQEKVPKFLSVDQAIEYNNVVESVTDKHELGQRLGRITMASYKKWIKELSHETSADVIESEENKLKPKLGSNTLLKWKKEALTFEYRTKKGGQSMPLRDNSNLSKKARLLLGENGYNEWKNSMLGL